MRKIKLTGYLDVPSERFDSVMAALPIHIAATRAEAGCISFEVEPCNTVKRRLNVAELFTSQDAFDFHQNRTSQSEWAKITKGIDRQYDIVEC